MRSAGSSASMVSFRPWSKPLKNSRFAPTKRTFTGTTISSRHVYLRQLQDTNEVLFYRLLLDHIEEIAPHRLHPGRCRGVPGIQPHLPASSSAWIISYPLRDNIRRLLFKNRPRRRQRHAWLPTASASLALEIKVSADLAFPSESFRFIR